MNAMFLFKNCEVYSPIFLGKKDILIAGGKIIALEDRISSIREAQEIQCDNLKAIPGLVDGHVHIAGAGGEGGPATRTKEIDIEEMLEGGITTVIGCLGTDGFTRNVESVLMKAKALRAQGLSAWIFTGAYQVPTPTITDNVGKDICFIDEVIGVGEIAISDHRSSVPSTEELIRLAEHARVAGMLAGKAGVVNLHMGDAKDPFRPIYLAIEKSMLPLYQFIPTHCNRNAWIFEDAKVYGQKGRVDITANGYNCYPDDEIKPSRAISELLKSGVPLQHITMSSDGGGSLPFFDQQGNLTKIERAKPKAIWIELLDTIVQENLSWQTALPVVTSNVADALRLNNKGRIAVGKDADIVLVNCNNQIKFVMSNGQIAMSNQQNL